MSCLYISNNSLLKNNYAIKNKPKSQIKKYFNSCLNCSKCCVEAFQEVKDGASNINCKKFCQNIFSLSTLSNRFPIIKYLPNYRLIDLHGDLIAGLTVGLTVIPQSLAYAKIAELPTQYGLYSSFMCYFIYSIFGTGRDVNIGPTAVMSLLTAEFAHSIPHLAALLAFLSGCIQVIMGLFSFGFVVDYISHPIINSFTTAASIAILCSQIKKWLGLVGVPREFVLQFYYTMRKLPETQLWDFLLGLICMIILHLLKKLKEINFKKNKNCCMIFIIKFIWFIGTARNALVIFVAAGASVIFYVHDKEPFTLTGNITSGIPLVQMPHFEMPINGNETLPAGETFAKMGIGIVIVPLVGIIEIIAIGKAFGRKNGYKIIANQELIALGLSNVCGSFFGAYPITGSFSRSAVLSQSGVRTVAANIFTGTIVLIAIAFLTPFFYFIPTSGLAAVIIMAVLDMIDFSMLKSLWYINKWDLLPWLVTFLLSLLIGFEYGILIGVFVSLLFLLHPWARPDIKGEFCSVSNMMISKTESFEYLNSLPQHENYLLIKVNIGFLFPAVEYFEDRICEYVEQNRDQSLIILDFTHIRKLDYTAAMTIKDISSSLVNQKINLLFINLNEEVKEILIRTKLMARTRLHSTIKSTEVPDEQANMDDEEECDVSDDNDIMLQLDLTETSNDISIANNTPFVVEINT